MVGPTDVIIRHRIRRTDDAGDASSSRAGELDSFPSGFRPKWRPQGDSNPCYIRERDVSWASRRWGRRSDLDSNGRLNFGGARRDRTADLLHAMQALSQLSYGPTRFCLQPFAIQAHEIKELNSRPPAPKGSWLPGTMLPRNHALGVPQRGRHDSKPGGGRLTANAMTGLKRRPASYGVRDFRRRRRAAAGHAEWREARVLRASADAGVPLNCMLS